MADKCKTCGATVYWARTKAGKAMPIDPEPVADGNIWVGLDRVAHVGDAGIAPYTQRFKSHFATCPNAATHRKKA